MKKLLLATVATLALTAGNGFAAEPNRAGPAAGAEMKGSAAGAEKKGHTAGSEIKAPRTTGSGVNSDVKAGAELKGKDKGAVSEPKGTKGMEKGAAAAGPHRETTGAGPGTDMKPGTAPKADSDTIKKDSGGARTEERTGSSGSQANAGASVNFTPEQKTKIRTTVIERGPKVQRGEINFSLNVGTAVPRSVHVVAVPPTLVEIHPAWRGYMYFVVGDELVIVEPGTLRIVAVVAV